LQVITQQARKKHLKISLMIDKNVTTIQADESRMKQVLLNLLGNAVKFTHKSGEVGLEVQGDTEQRVIHFTVWDTGIGIAEEDKERLFQPFVQLDSSLSREYTGAGLGLSMVCHIVNMHGGSISVESEVGKGSRFTVSLPWKTPDASTTHSEDYQPQTADLESSVV
jgi:signal transduction histidine kinase